MLRTAILTTLTHSVLVADKVPYWTSNYNGITDNIRLLGVDALGSDVTDGGLRHLHDIGTLEVLLLGGCKHVGDAGIQVC